MKPSNANDVRKALHRLISRIRDHVRQGLQDGVLHPQKTMFIALRSSTFRYREDGFPQAAQTIEYPQKETWTKAQHCLYQAVQGSKEYSAALALSNGLWHGDWELSNGFRHFVHEIIAKLLPDNGISDQGLDLLVETYIKELQGMPLPYHATVHLGGIIVSPNSLKFESHGLQIELRQPKPTDFEKEIEFASAALQGLTPPPGPHHLNPSAILEIGGSAAETKQIKFAMWKAVRILSLFRLGSVESIRSYIKSDRINDVSLRGEEFTLIQFFGPEKYHLEKSDTEKLKRFWDILWATVPEEFYWAPGKDTYTPHTVAYKRYTDGLANDTLVERRIANAVMGFEALLLTEKDELSYRLRMRAAKLLGSFRGDASTVRKVVGDAYSVRSTFVHGDQLTQKTRRKMGRDYKGALAELAATVLDYLRTTILLSLLWPKDKSKLIDLLDAAFIDESVQDDFNKWIEHARSVYSLTCVQEETSSTDTR